MTTSRDNKETLIPMNQIGDYRIPPKQLSQNAAPPKKAKPINMLQFASNEKVDHGELVREILGDEGTKKLHKGAVAGVYTAREAFLKKLKEVYDKNDNNLTKKGRSPEKDAIKLIDLLDESGLKLYQAAIKEEKNSIEYRNAVFLKATKKYPGPKWLHRLILWIAGPSACGKTTATDEIISQLTAKEMPNKGPENNEGNIIVAIDGGIERELSQISNLLLDVAKKKGYPGIYDLQDKTKLGIKKIIEKAALTKSDLNLVIPNTFTRLLTRLKIKFYNTLKNTRQIFARIVPRPQNKEEMRDAVYIAANKRAWEENYGEGKSSDTTFHPNTPLPFESKRYQSFYRLGTSRSESAERLYQSLSKTNITINVEHSFIFIFYDIKNNEWRPCSKKTKTKPTYFMPTGLFDQWKSEYRQNPTLEPKSWVAKQKSPTPVIHTTHLQSPTLSVSSQCDEITFLITESKKLLARMKKINQDTLTDDAKKIEHQFKENILVFFLLNNGQEYLRQPPTSKEKETLLNIRDGINHYILDSALKTLAARPGYQETLPPDVAIQLRRELTIELISQIDELQKTFADSEHHQAFSAIMEHNLVKRIINNSIDSQYQPNDDLHELSGLFNDIKQSLSNDPGKREILIKIGKSFDELEDNINAWYEAIQHAQPYHSLTSQNSVLTSASDASPDSSLLDLDITPDDSEEDPYQAMQISEDVLQDLLKPPTAATNNDQNHDLSPKRSRQNRVPPPPPVTHSDENMLLNKLDAFDHKLESFIGTVNDLVNKISLIPPKTNLENLGLFSEHSRVTREKSDVNALEDRLQPLAKRDPNNPVNK